MLSLLARQAPVAGDLRIVAALLHMIRCIERMGDQCVNMAKLVPLSGYEAPKDQEILNSIERMGQLARTQVDRRPRRRSPDATSSSHGTSPVRTWRSTGSTGRSSGARSRSATTRSSASGRC